MKRIKRFGVYQTAAVSAAIYFFIAAVFALFMGLILAFVPNHGSNPSFPFFGGIFLFIMPFLYGIIGFIMTAIFCAVYNLVARYMGGIEVEVETVNENVELNNPGTE